MNEHTWTTAALKEYTDSHLREIRDEILLRVDSQHREHDKFENEVHDSMYKQNEFRGALADLGLSMATRREVETIEEKYDMRLGRTESIQSKIVGALIFVSTVMMPAVVILTYFLSR